jgi:preprotein translocase subunit SecE
MKQVADITRFLGEVRAEMAKVVWPKMNELVGSTVVVLLIVAAFTVYLGSVDFVLARITELIFLRNGMQ